MKDILKKKITIFIIGLLVGAILSTGCCIIYSKAHFKNNNHGNRPAIMNQDGNKKEMKGGTPPSMPSNNSKKDSKQGQPQSIPGQQNTDSNTNTQTQAQTTDSNT